MCRYNLLLLGIFLITLFFFFILREIILTTSYFCVFEDVSYKQEKTPKT